MTDTDRKVDIMSALSLFDEEEGLVLNSNHLIVLQLVVLNHIYSLAFPLELVILGSFVIDQIINLVLFAVELGYHHIPLGFFIRWLVPVSDLSFGVTISVELLDLVIDSATVNELGGCVDIQVESIIAPNHLSLITRPHLQEILSDDLLGLFGEEVLLKIANLVKPFALQGLLADIQQNLKQGSLILFGPEFVEVNFLLQVDGHIMSERNGLG